MGLPAVVPPAPARRWGRLRAVPAPPLCSAPVDSQSGPFPISFLSDYGLGDEFVGVVRGVILRIAPQVRVRAVAPGVTRGDGRAGATGDGWDTGVISGAIGRLKQRFGLQNDMFCALHKPAPAQSGRTLSLHLC